MTDCILVKLCALFQAQARVWARCLNALQDPSKNYNRMTTIPNTARRRMNPDVIKKLNLSSGNISVSMIPFVSITGLTALNKITQVIAIRPTITSFINPANNEPSDTGNGPIKNKMIKNKVAPKRIHEYFVFSLY